MNSVENINTNYPIGLEGLLRNIETLPPCDKQSSDAKSLRQFLTDLAMNVYQGGALNNNFYDAWTTRRISLDKIAALVRNYGRFVRSFPELLAAMIMRADNVIARTELAKTLFHMFSVISP